MYLHQKLKYNYKHLDNIEELKEVISDIGSINYMCFDTETTGLNIITDLPFLVSFGYEKNVYTFDWDKEWFGILMDKVSNTIPLFAHNAKYDYHMVWNGGYKISDNTILYDSITVARLTESADETISMSLESLGTKYVDDSSKFAGHIIKELIKKKRAVRKNALKYELVKNFPDDKFHTTTKDGRIRYTGKITKLMEDYDRRVSFVDDNNIYFKFIDENYKEPNYKDIYEDEPELMRNYAADDIVIMLEYLNKALPVLKDIDVDFKVLKREGQLIHVIADLENNGFKVDIDYILKCRVELINYQRLLYSELMIYTGRDFKVGQHDYIKKMLLIQFEVKTDKDDEKALKYIKNNTTDETLISVITNILELRTVDKWLSTYIDGKLNSIINGRIYTDINNSGAVSGRVSCDMQQQPKEALNDRDGNELFHPRKMFICDEGTKLFFIDESNMELRVQAYLTILHSKEPDMNLCRAYMPYKCYNDLTTMFDYTNREHLLNFRSKKWYECGTGTEWKPTDLHSETTKHAFPFIDPDSDKFQKYRKLGKRCNFLKLYQGGVKALQESLEIDMNTARALDDAFYKAFPRVRDYQEWIENQLKLYGYIENLYGRRYYMSDDRTFYKGCNYLIQGSCADMIKTFEINIYNYIKENKLKMKMILPIHDELVISVPFDEEEHIKNIKAIMEDTLDVIKYIPMVADVEYSTTNWKEKNKL